MLSRRCRPFQRKRCSSSCCCFSGRKQFVALLAYVSVALLLLIILLQYRSSSLDVSRVVEYASQNEDTWDCTTGIFKLPAYDKKRQNAELIFTDNVTCFVEGTDSVPDSKDESTGTKNGTVCRCKPGWYGQSCSIPAVVWLVETPWPKDRLVLRKEPRRIVHAFPFNHELDTLDMKFAELSDVVDVFLILESNFTAYGTAKSTLLLNRIQSGQYPKSIVRKIVHVFLDYFPSAARKNGWIADSLQRNYLWSHGLPRINDSRADDLFVMTDADEFPSRTALLFLKWHDGYSEPVYITYRWSIYGFYWGHPSGTGKFQVWHHPAAVTMNMVRNFFRDKLIKIRDVVHYMHNEAPQDLKKYIEQGGKVQVWTLGNVDHVAGWHCSYCFPPEGIRVKLISTHISDPPRYGDNPEKCNVTYLRGLIARGMWFDEKQQLQHYPLEEVPASLMKNRLKYRHLIENIYDKESRFAAEGGSAGKHPMLGSI